MFKIDTSNGGWIGKVLLDKFDLTNSRFSPNADLRYLVVGGIIDNIINKVLMNQTTDFSQTNLQGSSFVLQDIQGVIFNKADLSQAFLSYAQCSKAQFLQAKLVKADLSYADLSGAKFNAADLTGANLTDANLNGTHLKYTSLKNANLTNTIFNSSTNFTYARLKGAKYSTKTQFNGTNITDDQIKEMVVQNT